MKKKLVRILIDLEFTGLDNTFIKDNEIIQLKMCNFDNGLGTFSNYRVKKKLSAHVLLSHDKNVHRKGTFFSAEIFQDMLKDIDVKKDSVIEYYGFGVQKDMEMLAKYGIHIHINDIREMLQLSKYEKRLATEGSSLEAAYMIVFNERPKIKDHNGTDELIVILNLFKNAVKCQKKKFLTVMPHGHCAGMPLSQYVQEYRRASDGYRYNNNDLLSKSLTSAIENYEMEIVNDEDDY